MSTFVVRAAAYERDEDLESEYLVLAEQPDGDGRRLEIQRSLAPPTDEDRAHGMDTYCLVDESGAAHYGGVRDWRLRDGRLDIELTPQAAEVLRTEGYSLTFDGAADTGAVETGLGSLLS